MDALKLMSESCLKKDIPVVNVGDTVRVQVRIQEGNRERLQAFEGTVIAKKHGGIAEPSPFAVFLTAAASRVFPIHSPKVASVELVRKGRVRRGRAVLSARQSEQGCQGPRKYWANLSTKGERTLYVVLFCFIMHIRNGEEICQKRCRSNGSRAYGETTHYGQ